MAPPGIGEDTHRTWESIILGAVPVVFKSKGWPGPSVTSPGPKVCIIVAGLSSLWQKAPVLVISDPAEIDKHLLDSFTVNTNMRRDVALASYWIDRINSFRTS